MPVEQVFGNAISMLLACLVHMPSKPRLPISEVLVEGGLHRASGAVLPAWALSVASVLFAEGPMIVVDEEQSAR